MLLALSRSARSSVVFFAFFLGGDCIDTELHAVGQVAEKVSSAVEEKLLQASALQAYGLARTDEERIAALAALEPLAEKGDLNAILVVAGHYSLYPTSEADLRKSFELYLRGAEFEDPTCLLLVGVKYGAGEGVEEDREKAFAFLDRAIEAGSAEAYKAKAHLLLKPETFEEAKALLWRACELGVVDAHAYLGDIFYYGEFCEADPVLALAHFEKAMEGGDAYSAVMVGDCYLQGLGGGKDSSKAYSAFIRAKELGDARAWNRLGRMYLFGEGASFDIELSVAHFRKGIEVGDRESMIWLGVAYSVPGADFEDTEECFLWTYVAGEMGVETARSHNQDLAAYLSSKAREELKAKAAPIIAQLKEGAP
ncbi:tetratricopeptide repeat protein [Pelagicoccus enzymogenes]|uniref:tetratricopeptide repeat protein n=1 Tax=Pelagicoccus enzymogenes TaxID=2773457 RepID=UPI0028103BDF|nr:tetratricopeptide repeat protein [Pelagicoccus enzymogenes]MDQ8200421.1 tetratricopeptide repeat protein [Pelagicoccus enzymogenes]